MFGHGLFIIGNSCLKPAARGIVSFKQERWNSTKLSEVNTIHEGEQENGEQDPRHLKQMKIDYCPLPAIVDDGENGGGPYTLHPRDSMIDSIIIQRSSYYGL